MFHLLTLLKLYRKYRHTKTVFKNLLSQLTYNCAKSTMETLEKGMKYVQR